MDEMSKTINKMLKVSLSYNDYVVVVHLLKISLYDIYSNKPLDDFQQTSQD